MSTLNVANVTDGTTSVPTEYVVNGSAKSWVNFQGTSTVSIRESLNISSVTDRGTGQYTPNLSSNMSNANFSVGASTSFLSGVTHMVHFIPDGADGGNVASAIRGETRRTDNNSQVDLSYIMLQAFGDLA
jgi:hypothetical protein